MLVTDNMLVWKAAKFDIISGFAIVINGIYLVDMIMNFVVLGFKQVWKTKGFLYLELVA